MSGKARLHKLPTPVKWRQPAPPRPSPKWTPYVHPADRGFFILTGGAPASAALARLGIKAEFAAVRGRQTEGSIYWAPGDARDTVATLTAVNAALKVNYNTAATIMLRLAELPGWEDVAAELRACYSLGADGEALRSIINQLTDAAQAKAQGDP